MKNRTASVVMILCATLLVNLHISEAWAGEWQEGMGEVTVANITPEEARNQAFDLARKDALERASMTFTGLTSELTHQRSSQDVYRSVVEFTRTVCKGRIMKVDTLFDDLERPKGETGPNSPWIYRVTLRAYVEPERGETDPAFHLDMALNRTVFRDGDTVVVQLQATKDCYVTLLNLYSNDSLSIILPNSVCRDNHVRAGSAMQIPPDNQGWSLPIRLLQGRSSDDEALMAIATKTAVLFPAPNSKSFGQLIAIGDALTAINKWLLDIDASQRAQSLVTYRIVQ